MMEGGELPRTYLPRIQTQAAYVQPRKHQDYSMAGAPMPIVKNIIAWALIWMDRGWTGSPYTIAPRIPSLKKNTPWDTPRRLAATSQLVPTTQTGRIKKKTHKGRGCKVECQAYSSIFHTHAWAYDLVNVFAQHAAPPWWSSLSLVVHTVDTDRAPVYCSGISMLPVQLWLWQAHTGLVIISHLMSTHWWWGLVGELYWSSVFYLRVQFFHDETRCIVL